MPALPCSCWTRSAPLLLVFLLALAACESPEAPTEEAQVAGAIEQQVAEATERLSQSEGGELVQRVIDAHGGLEAWYRAPTSSYTWEYANADADLRFTSFLVADNQTRDVYHDLLVTGSYEDPDTVEARFAWDGQEAWIYPEDIERPNPAFWGISGYYFQQIPFVLTDPGVNYELLPDEELNGTTYEMVRTYFGADVGASPGDSYTLYVHPETGQVDAIRYTVSYGRDVPPNADLPETLLFYEDLVTVDGLMTATTYRGYDFTADGERGAFKNEAFADSLSFTRPFDRARLEAPEGARFVRPE